MSKSNLDLARECGATVVDSGVLFVGHAQLDAFAERIRAEALASAQPSPAAAELVMGSYVQPVPDHCDRITWRNHYYHLPPSPQPLPQERKPLTNAQIFEAIKAVGLVKNQAAIAGARAIERAHGITTQQGEPS